MYSCIYAVHAPSLPSVVHMHLMVWTEYLILMHVAGTYVGIVPSVSSKLTQCHLTLTMCHGASLILLTLKEENLNLE